MSKAHGNELWVMLLEKAYAKYYGSFADIIGGFGEDAFRDLTGYPSYRYRNKDTDDAWEKINEANQKNYAMTAATISDKSIKD